ncbi:type II toxin-antitoxin system HicB family antitoxin [Methylobacter sp. BlB1]|jgi:predicted RNase H-like HicB family nuclease|uniref:type II toxin-antitoxin system HicB family antitoxin n=1 Tax=Methylobacter sp. BlB1 TaxID=2785914 RepID=UPI001894F166|nr:type II toxin-antitoxin system HicB family antitoxin [Methylobacter sp. BlB1]MBF6648761.1 type II toxin-antitoxin system HicB family antitoxin [Methylobacter sp. BlB1]
MNNKYTAVIMQDGGWWLGWIEEIPGINCQEATHDELIESLKITLQEALAFNREAALLNAGTHYHEELIVL